MDCKPTLTGGPPCMKGGPWWPVWGKAFMWFWKPQIYPKVQWIRFMSFAPETLGEYWILLNYWFFSFWRCISRSHTGLWKADREVCFFFCFWLLKQNLAFLGCGWPEAWDSSCSLWQHPFWTHPVWQSNICWTSPTNGWFWLSIHSCPLPNLIIHMYLYQRIPEDTGGY